MSKLLTPTLDELFEIAKASHGSRTIYKQERFSGFPESSYVKYSCVKNGVVINRPFNPIDYSDDAQALYLWVSTHGELRLQSLVEPTDSQKHGQTVRLLIEFTPYNSDQVQTFTFRRNNNHLYVNFIFHLAVGIVRQQQSDCTKQKELETYEH